MRRTRGIAGDGSIGRVHVDDAVLAAVRAVADVASAELREAEAAPVEPTPEGAPDTQADVVVVPEAAVQADEVGETPVASPPAEEA
jgi:hypothetical protein